MGKADDLRAMREASLARPTMRERAAKVVAKVKSAVSPRAGIAEPPKQPDPQENSGRTAGSNPATGAKIKRGPGRPRIEDYAKTNEAQKPWLAENMSRSSWYRRERERKEAKT